LGDHLAMEISIAKEKLGRLGSPEVKLQIMVLGEANGTVNLMCLRRYPAVSLA
jgi:hypothetical protein